MRVFKNVENLTKYHKHWGEDLFTLVTGCCDCSRGLGRHRLLRKIGKISISQPSIAGYSRFAV